MTQQQMPTPDEMNKEIAVLNTKLAAITALQIEISSAVGTSTQSHETDHALLFTAVNMLLLEHISMIESIKRSIQKFIDNGMSSALMPTRS